MERVLLVCMGNICRSPTAEGIVRALADRRGLSSILRVDSAGTHAGHAKEAPDPRAVKVAKVHGISLSGLFARQVTQADFELFDRILAMDRRNLAHLRRVCPVEHAAKLGLFLDYATGLSTDEVPDPYYGNLQGFEKVFELCESAAHGLLESVASLNGIRPGETSRR